MSWILMAAVLTSSPAPRQAEVLPADAPRFLEGNVQTGTLLFSKGDCLAVKVYTQSPFTHVAAVVIRHGQPFVYDSAQGAGVRCQTLENYLASQNPAEVYVFQPQRRLSADQAGRMEGYLDSQLGRRYGIKHHLTGKRADGVHCAEYVVDSLIACELMQAQQPWRVSPASLVEGIVESDLYTQSLTLALKTPSVPRPAGQGRCREMWSDTKDCTRNCYLWLRGAICCY